MYVAFNDGSHTETDVMLIAHQKNCISYHLLCIIKFSGCLWECAHNIFTCKHSALTCLICWFQDVLLCWIGSFRTFVCVCVSRIKLIKALCYAALKRFNPRRMNMLHTVYSMSQSWTTAVNICGCRTIIVLEGLSLAPTKHSCCFYNRLVPSRVVQKESRNFLKAKLDYSVFHHRTLIRQSQKEALSVTVNILQNTNVCFTTILGNI